MSPRAVAVGDNCVDVYYLQNRFYPTGNAVDFAVNLAGLGVESALVSILGDDVFAPAVEALLDRFGVAHPHLYPGGAPTAVARMVLRDGDRVHEHFWGNVLAGFSLDEARLHYIRGFDVIYSEKWSRIGRYIESLAGGGRILVHDFSKRLDDPTNADILPHLDCAFFSYHRPDAFIEAFLRDACAAGCGTAVAMLGEHGSLAYDGARFCRQAALPAAVVNTVGAGDSFIAGFVAALCEGEPLPQCMRRGAEQAAEIIGRFEPY